MESSESLSTTLTPPKALALLGQLVQGAGDGGKVSDEPLEIGGQAQEAANLGYGYDCGHLGWVGDYPLTADNMAQEGDAPVEQMALLGVEAEPSAADGMKNISQVLECPFEVSRVCQEVLQIHHTAVAGNVSKNPFHEPLEGGRGVAQSERHHPELPLWAGLGCQLHLPLPAPKFEGAEPGGA